MSMAQVIRAAMKKQGVTVSQLSRQLGCTTQNISGKMRRDNFRESELQEIAAAIGRKSLLNFQLLSAVGLRVVLFQKKQESRLNNIPVSWVGKLLQQLTHSAFLRLF